MSEKYTDLRTLPNGTRFYIENGDWYGYIFEKNGKKYLHIDETWEEYPVTGKEDLVVTIIQDKPVKLSEPEILLLEGCILKINNEYTRLYWNKNHKELNSPIENTGNTYQNDTFTLRAYDWNGNEQPNFSYKSLQASWYKHLGRGTIAIVNEHDKTLKFFSQMVHDCIRSLQNDPNLREENDY